MAFIDPPYNVSIANHATRRSKHREFAMASGEMSSTEFEAFLHDTFLVAAGVSRDGAVQFAMMDWRHMMSLQLAAAGVYGPPLNLCVWNKSNAGLGSLYRSKHELVLVLSVGAAKPFNAIELGRSGRHRSNVWDYESVTSPRGSRRSDRSLHPTAKPVAMVADAIKDVTRRGDIVLDPFLGSGTTLVAAERTGRCCRGIEIDPVYVDIAIKRWSDITGLRPQRALTKGRTRLAAVRNVCLQANLGI